MTGKDEKTERLAAALRANLRRRKAQARGDAPAGARLPVGQDGASRSADDECQAGGAD